MELSDYLRVTRAHWVGVVAILLTTVALAGVFTLTRTEVYAANANGFWPYTPATNSLYGLKEACAMLDTNRIENATAGLCLWWLRHHRARLRQEWA